MRYLRSGTTRFLIHEKNGLSRWLPGGLTDERLDNAVRCLEGWLEAQRRGPKVD